MYLHVIAVALMCLVAGCGPASSPYPTAHVAGNITLDGAPIESGNISFVPEGAGQARPTAVDFHAGRYRVDDAPLGAVRVRIVAAQPTGKMIAGSGQPEPEIVDIVPAKYREGVLVEITGDDDQLHFHWTTN